MPEVSVISFLPLQFFIFVRLLRVQFSDPYKNVGKTSVLYISKIVSVLTFLKIVLLIVPINCKNFAKLNSTSLETYMCHTFISLFLLLLRLFSYSITVSVR